MGLTHKSQSALEYLMTYGWAILVIVIVAAVLYSLGIFSPSSAITASVTGFSNLGSVTAQAIPNSGLVLSLGDTAGYNINITNITISLDGKTSTIKPNTLISTTSSSKFFIPFSSIPASSSYSFTVTVYYTEPGQIFPGPYTSTGTVFGTSTSSSGFYQPITITNSQTTPTPAPFQQMINMSIRNGGWYGTIGMIAPNYQNVEFFSSNGSAIPSWLENYSSSQFIYWIKLQNGIPASSSVTVYMVYFPKSDNVFNSLNDGEAPLLSSTYGEYDDGDNVFNYYTSFSGTTLPSAFIIAVCPNYISVDNGVTLIQGSGCNPQVSYIGTINPQTTAVMTGVKVYNPNGGTAIFTSEGFYTSLNAGMGNQGGSEYYIGICTSPYTPSSYTDMPISSGSSVSSTPLDVPMMWLTSSGYYVLDTITGNLYSVPYANSDTSSSFYYMTGTTDSAEETIYFTALLPVPPNGVMPSVSFGAVY